MIQVSDQFAWNCCDCGFVGTWLTDDGTCPKCGGRDLPTQPSEPRRKCNRARRLLMTVKTDP